MEGIVADPEQKLFGRFKRGGIQAVRRQPRAKRRAAAFVVACEAALCGVCHRIELVQEQ